MYDIIELNGKKVAELREIATKLDINRVDKLKKQDLVYAILDEQALRPQESKSSIPAKSDRKKTVPKKRATDEATDRNTDKNSEDKKERRNMRDRRDKRRKEETFEEKKEVESDNKSDKRITKRDDKRDDKGERGNRRDNRKDRNERGERNDRGERHDRGDRNNRNRNNQRRDKHDKFISDPEEHGYNFDNLVEIEGVLEVQQEGHGILRSADYNYLNSPDDVYVSPKQMKQFSIQNGDTVVAGIRPPRIGEKFYPLISVKSVNIEH